jgi:uncharacterized OsmC-like protein
MMTDEESRLALERAVSVYKRRGSAALNMVSGSASITEGMRCEFTQGELKAISDMPKIVGGGATAPTPGFYARASIAGCVATSIKAAAIRAGIALRKITVDLEMDFDDGASMGVGDRSAAPLETRLAIRVDTDAPQKIVDDLVSRALTVDPYYLALRDPQIVKTSVTKA